MENFLNNCLQKLMDKEFWTDVFLAKISLPFKKFKISNHHQKATIISPLIIWGINLKT